MNNISLITRTRLKTAIAEKELHSLIGGSVSYSFPAVPLYIDITSGVGVMPQTINQS